MSLNRQKGVAEGGSRLNRIVPNRYKRLATASGGLRNRPPSLVLDITLLAPAEPTEEPELCGTQSASL